MLKRACSQNCKSFFISESHEVQCLEMTTNLFLLIGLTPKMFSETKLPINNKNKQQNIDKSITSILNFQHLQFKFVV